MTPKDIRGAINRAFEAREFFAVDDTRAIATAAYEERTAVLNGLAVDLESRAEAAFALREDCDLSQLTNARLEARAIAFRDAAVLVGALKNRNGSVAPKED